MGNNNEGIVAFDVTGKFRAAAGGLELGELVKDGFFSLFESVGALEIMDPKMDSGCLAPGESLDEDYDVGRPLSPGEVIGIIDQLFCLEMAWYQGYPLSQTLLTNVYIDRMLEPEPVTLQEADFIREGGPGEQRDAMHTVLRAYCLGLVKCCWYINDRIKFEHYYEEEDFVTNTYHRSLLDNFDLDEINDEIMAARKLVHSIRHRITDELAQALGFRLELRTAFLRAIELSVLRSNPESLSLPWTQMQAVWESIYKSRHLGQPVPEAFSTKIQRRLASTMPPRPIVKLSTEETYKHFKKLFVDGINVLNVLNYHDSQSLLNFVMTFQSQKPQPLVYIRTLLQSFLFKDMIILGKLSIRHVLDDDLSLVVLPASKLLDPANDLVEAPHHPSYALAHQMELFRQRAAQSYLDIFRAFCQNRCRIRRTLCHSIQDWETVQVDAEEIDQLLQLQIDERPLVYPPTGGEPSASGVEPTYSLPLSSWAYLYKLRLMEWIVQLGFELEIYAPDELGGMYWYLSDLARSRARLVDRISFFTKHRAQEKENTSAQEEAAFTKSRHYLYQTSLDAAITWEMADALSNLYAALGRLELITPPPRPYSTDEMRYDVRMKPFVAIGLPELPSWEVYRAATDRVQVETGRLLEDARLSLEQAQRGLEVMGRLTEKESFSVGCWERWVGG
ncbi:Mak10 subunit, NatC N-terminal acetyltransferase-domain-containing protein [Apiosordaria backusii]|uniref:Mak10 subunit, NatC N-terminal acetyltransferase-domain-containing protein n=1 Tax=Apiosordaria backusii TaxID=314023 RepID=A0AA40F047_9PEZI|nr:Mak10 subunit, NatC N-terminal acetyltransferase-domain-containing protein [Apiosordaria backusii]